MSITVWIFFSADVEPPTFERCPNTLLFYTNENEDSSYVHWHAPIVKDNKDVSLIPRKISGPASSTLQNVGTYIVTYEAEDSNGNKAEDCTFVVVVKRELFRLLILCIELSKHRSNHIYIVCDIPNKK